MNLWVISPIPFKSFILSFLHCSVLAFHPSLLRKRITYHSPLPPPPESKVLDLQFPHFPFHLISLLSTFHLISNSSTNTETENAKKKPNPDPQPSQPILPLTALKTLSINGASNTSCTSLLNQLLLTAPNSACLARAFAGVGEGDGDGGR